jgi:hypothetical protein
MFVQTVCPSPTGPALTMAWRDLPDNVNKDLVPVTVLEVKQGFVPCRRNVGMVQYLGNRWYGNRCFHRTFDAIPLVQQFDNRKVLGFLLDGLREQGDRISG